MRSVKVLQPIASWVMRIALALFVYAAYSSQLIAFNTASSIFWIAAAYCCLTILLLCGGIFRNNALTILSGLGLTFITAYQAFIIAQSAIDYKFAVYMLLGGIALFFVANGNQ